MPTDTPLRVAILGGGLAGAAAFRALSTHPHLSLSIFESASTFSEPGQGIGFNANAMHALDLLGLQPSLSAAGAVRINTTRHQIGQGPETGAFLFDMDQRERGTWIVQRSSFLEQLYTGIEPSMMHTGKKLSSLEQHGDGITLSFEDGTTHDCDVLLGADGIHSSTRRYVLGAEHAEAAEPVFAGWWTVWQLRPYDDAVKCLGSELVDPHNPRQYMWTGPNGAVMHDLLGGNQLVQCVIVQRVSEKDGSTAGEWKKSITKQELRQHLDGWDTRLRDGMINLLCPNDDEEPIPMISLWHHPTPIPSLSRGTVAILGDAAGATTPWQGSGGGMAMEDAYLLKELFAHVRTRKEAQAALRGYDAVNRPRRQKIVDSSYEAGLLMTGSHGQAGMDPERLREGLERKWDFIFDVDLLASRDRAIKVMREVLEG